MIRTSEIILHKINKTFFKVKINKILLVIWILPLLFRLTPIFVSASSEIVFESYVETADIISKDNVHETIEIFFDFEQSQDSINFFLVPGI